MLRLRHNMKDICPKCNKPIDLDLPHDYDRVLNKPVHRKCGWDEQTHNQNLTCNMNQGGSEVKGDIGKSDQEQKEKFRGNYDGIFRKEKEPVRYPGIMRNDKARQKILNKCLSEVAGRMATNPKPYADPFPIFKIVD